MGGIVSRISPDVTFDHGINESFNRLKSSFDKTPKYKVIDDKIMDPRSATLEINRTPLCLLDLPDEEGSTPVARNRKKWKRRSSSRISDNESNNSTSHVSRSFEFSTNMSPWEPRECMEQDSIPEDTDEKYGNVVEELRECLSKVTVTTVYEDESPEKNDDQEKATASNKLNNQIKTSPHKVSVHKPTLKLATITNSNKLVNLSTLNKKGNVSTPNKDATPPLVVTPVSKDLKKNWVWSPDYFINSKSPVAKERTPLGIVSTNVVKSRQLNSASLRHQGKFWRGPLDERAKLQGENTPPSSLLPPFGSPRSAPATNRHLSFHRQ